MTKTHGNSQVSPYEIKLINMSLEEMIERAKNSYTSTVEDNKEIRRLLNLIGGKIHENEEGDQT